MAGIVGEPEALLAAGLLELAAREGAAIHVARSEARAARLAAAARALGAGIAVALLPGWDCLPYDRASPSREVMGTRTAALWRLAHRGEKPGLLILGVEAALQRVVPPVAPLRLAVGDTIEPDALAARLERLGYVFDDRVDEPGEAALHGAVVDLFPASGQRSACRVEHEDGTITAIRRYDPVTQRSRDEVRAVALHPASELVLPETAVEGLPDRHRPGLEHALPRWHEGGLGDAFALLPGAPVLLEPEVAELRAQRLEEIADAFHARLAMRGEAGQLAPLEPAALYLDETAWEAALAGRAVTVLDEPEEQPAGALPELVDDADGLLRCVDQALEAGGRVALAAAGRAGRDLARLVAEHLGAEPEEVAGWLALREAAPGRCYAIPGLLEHGFRDGKDLLLAPGELWPGRGARRVAGLGAALPGEAGLRPGDAVIHAEHGLGALRGVEAVAVGDNRVDCLRLEYAGGAMQLAPVDEIDRIWRYGAEAGSVTLDRLQGEGWAKRRAAAEQAIAGTAHALVQLAKERAGARAPAIKPPARRFERFNSRFRFSLTPDQERAIRDTLADLASGKPMDRLVCGDVGFGKTEVALRAAAAVALSGKQVALLAPTTVLVRQHVENFRGRFAGLGVRVESLSRLETPAEQRAVKAGLASGEIGVVIGTSALAAKGVRFKDLALVIVDEEQRFGTQQKNALRRLGAGIHSLVMTATPIPRTLQSALIGLQTLSVIATPPARRQPIRTTRAPLDPALVAEALRAAHRRGGQGFFVVPRIEDIEPMRALLAEAVPELSVLVAHGDMKPAEMDGAMVRFAAGDADVLLSTNIVEAGLDVPRASTMLVWRPDRFGLSQLHQLRGRVGRGRLRGTVLLLSDPEAKETAAADKRLRTLEAMDRIGAGFSISARDMDLRGAGELMGEEQAGHVALIGLGLYRHLLDGALRAARDEPAREEWVPVVSAGVDAFIPEEYVAEEALRVELHTRLGAVLRAGDGRALAEFAAEVEDRFGPPPEPVENLLALARLRLACRAAGVERLEAGPNGAAARFHAGLRGEMPDVPGLERKGEKLVLHRNSADAAGRLAAATALLAALRRPGGARRRAA